MRGLRHPRPEWNESAPKPEGKGDTSHRYLWSEKVAISHRDFDGLALNQSNQTVYRLQNY